MVQCGDDRYLNLAEAAKMLDCSVGTINRRIEAGKIAGSFKIGRKVYIPKQNITQFINEQKARA